MSFVNQTSVSNDSMLYSIAFENDSNVFWNISLLMPQWASINTLWWEKRFSELLIILSSNINGFFILSVVNNPIIILIIIKIDIIKICYNFFLNFLHLIFLIEKN